MKKSRVVCLLLILSLMFGMFVGCTNDKKVTGNENNSLTVDEGDINDPFAE